MRSNLPEKKNRQKQCKNCCPDLALSWNLSREICDLNPLQFKEDLLITVENNKKFRP